MTIKPMRGEAPLAEATCARSHDGHITLEILINDKTIYFEIGRTKYAGYIEVDGKIPILFDGPIDLV